jgi:hypothetical protein
VRRAQSAEHAQVVAGGVLRRRVDRPIREPRLGLHRSILAFRRAIQRGATSTSPPTLDWSAHPGREGGLSYERAIAASDLWAARLGHPRLTNSDESAPSITALRRRNDQVGRADNTHERHSDRAAITIVGLVWMARRGLTLLRSPPPGTAAARRPLVSTRSSSGAVAAPPGACPGRRRRDPVRGGGRAESPATRTVL